jgi:hypothetical protein
MGLTLCWIALDWELSAFHDAINMLQSNTEEEQSDEAYHHTESNFTGPTGTNSDVLS